MAGKWITRLETRASTGHAADTLSTNEMVLSVRTYLLPVEQAKLVRLGPLRVDFAPLVSVFSHCGALGTPAIR